MKAIQESLEDISYLLRIPQRKSYGSMEGDVKKSMKIAMDNKEAILASIPEEHKEEGAKLYTSLLEEKTGLQTLLKYIKENNPDKLSIALASSLDTVAELELLQGLDDPNLGVSAIEERNALGLAIVLRFSHNSLTSSDPLLPSSFQPKESHLHAPSLPAKNPTAAKEAATGKQICTLEWPFKDRNAILDARAHKNK
ncbi:Peptidyl-prolyl cis-trans isomerase CYP37, chloroplastic [Zea mays]|uniref:Peptidyl-prolyl cis-trans isomerase CYP37, chloroplastic n=1 Tax=Zea mays TaxID=4577 RepID=A0A3L6E250_MAIZE|nr:Peptidyl-prolyl cis-trans isomerase CYP37, chloroplastic [Zea mays]